MISSNCRSDEIPWSSLARQRRRYGKISDRAFTLFELMAVLAIIAIVGMIAISNLRSFDNTLAKGTFSVEQFLQTARSTAISGTQIVKVQPSSETGLIALKGATCETATTPIEALTLELPSTVSFTDTAWFLCFNSRGLADANITFDLADETASRSISVALGGGVRISN